MPIHDAAYNGSPCALQVLASSAISLAKFAALVSMITWRSRASAARGIVRRLTITTSVHELVASKARTSADPTCPVPPTTKTRKPIPAFLRVISLAVLDLWNAMRERCGHCDNVTLGRMHSSDSTLERRSQLDFLTHIADTLAAGTIELPAFPQVVIKLQEA